MKENEKLKPGSASHDSKAYHRRRLAVNEFYRPAADRSIAGCRHVSGIDIAFLIGRIDRYLLEQSRARTDGKCDLQ
jgi:hypothetical protein